jgi:hypothetical protein
MATPFNSLAMLLNSALAQPKAKTSMGGKGIAGKPIRRGQRVTGGSRR